MIVACYLLVIVSANLLIACLGPGWTPLVGFFAIGLDLTLRDKLHESWGGRRLLMKMAGLIAAGGIISALLSPGSGRVVWASLLAFACSSGVDAWVYDRLRYRSKENARYASNIAGAAVDSLIFPVVAFAAWLPMVMLLQLTAKAAGGMLWAWLLNLRGRD